MANTSKITQLSDELLVAKYYALKELKPSQMRKCIMGQYSRELVKRRDIK